MMFISQKKHQTIALTKAIFLFGALLLGSGTAFAQDPSPSFLAKVKQGAVVLADESGKVLLGTQVNRTFPPASTLKILTSHVAIKSLGLKYHPKTEFYLGPKHQLGIKGFGDPYLISEEITVIAKKLKALGYTHFSKVQLDTTQFVTPPKAPGTTATLNPYDALNGALAVNFNSLFLTRSKKGTVRSAEKATPLTPLAAKKGKLLGKGTTDRFNLTNNPAESLEYVAQLFKAIFAKEGIKTGGTVVSAPLGPEFRLILTHRNSRNLKVMLTGLLKYSNNYIANQLFLILGAEAYGWPAEDKKSLRFLREEVEREFQPQAKEFYLAEASGISRDNQMTPLLMLKVLEVFKPYHQLMHKHRKIKAAYLKSGTLTGVYNYAGYFKTKTGLRPFVIFLNEPKNHRDQLLAELWKYSKTH